MHLADPFTPSFFRRLQQLKIRTRRVMLGSRQGSHTTNRRGHGLEFSDFRPYTAGDDYRHIDWGVYGRSDRLYVREFRAEQDLNVLVLLDTSASMAYPDGAGKFELARNIALALGYVALSDGDTVTFGPLGHDPTPKFSGHRALGRAVQKLSAIEPGGAVDIVREVGRMAALQRLPAKCFFISDFMFENALQFQALDILRGRNFDITVVQILAPAELNLQIDNTGLLVDAETGESLDVAFDKSSQREYVLRLAEHIEALERYCRSAGIAHLLVSSEEPLAEIVLSRFPQAGVLK